MTHEQFGVYYQGVVVAAAPIDESARRRESYGYLPHDEDLADFVQFDWQEVLFARARLGGAGDARAWLLLSRAATTGYLMNPDGTVYWTDHTRAPAEFSLIEGAYRLLVW